MKLTKELYLPSEVAKIFQVSPDTVREWIRTQKISPDEIVVTPGGHKRIKRSAIIRLLNEQKTPLKKITVVYARESSSHQKESLQRQIETLIEWANKQGYSVDQVIKDIGSGMNLQRKGFLKLIEMAEEGILDTIIIAYKDRLVRFGYDFFEWFFGKHGVKLVVMNQIDNPPNRLQEIIDDFISIIHYFAMRIYGARSYKKISKLKQQLLKEIDDDGERISD